MNVFDLFARLKFDSNDYEKGLANASDGFSKLGGLVGTGLKTAAAVGTAAVGAAAAGVTALAKSSISQYADYEQLIGGVETLYGNAYASAEEYANSLGVDLDFAAETWEAYQQRQQKVLDNAANAYKTSGLSVNDYMETVTGFAAALNESLGAYAYQSADYAETAIVDMADNANKMGTSIDSIKNAYAGFAKGNFTMLDNLKIGFGGTGEEMDRLLRKAEELEGLEVETLSKNNFADIVEAIHVVQENLGIAGTTAKEASTTISGSVATAKSAFTNMLTAFADGSQDFDQLFNNFVDSAGTALTNILPRIATVIQTLADKMPLMLQTVYTIIMEQAPGIIQSVIDLMQNVAGVVLENAPMIADTVANVISMVVNNLPALMAAVIEIATAVAGRMSEIYPVLLPSIIETVLQIATMMVENIQPLMSAAIEMITALANGLINSLPLLNDYFPEIMGAVVSGLVMVAGDLLFAAIAIITELITALVKEWPRYITQVVPKLGKELLQAFLDIATYFTEVAPKWLNTIRQKIEEKFPGLIDTVARWLAEMTVKIEDWVAKVRTTIQTKLTEIINMAKEIFSNLPYYIGLYLGNAIGNVITFTTNLNNKITAEIPKIINKVRDFFAELPGKIYNALTGTISKISMWRQDMIAKIIEVLPSIIAHIRDFFEQLPGNMVSIGSRIVDGIWAGIFNSWGALQSNVNGFINGLVGGVKNVLGIHSPSRVFAGIGENMALGLGEGWGDEIGGVRKDITSGLSFSGSMSAPTAAGGGNNAILALLQQYLPEVANSQIVLDTGALVGQTAPAYDRELGRLANKAAKGVY